MNVAWAVGEDLVSAVAFEAETGKRHQPERSQEGRRGTSELVTAAGWS